MELTKTRFLVVAATAAEGRWQQLRRSSPELSVVDTLEGGISGLASYDAVVLAEGTDHELRERAWRVRSSRRLGLLPLVAFTGDARTSVPSIGCDNFIMGEFDLSRLEPVLASLRELSRRVHDLPVLDDMLEPEQAGETNVLRYMVTRQLEWLEPAREPRSPIGYSYGPVAAILGCKVGRERSVLTRLCQAGKLASRFTDRIHVCPFCDVYQLNFRLTCSACGTANIQANTAIHHYRCAFVGPKDRFQTPDGLVCPKCQRGLRHIGVDYEEVGQAYLCVTCQMAITDPPVQCLCLQCGRTFEPEKARVEVIESYELTAAGYEMARQVGRAKGQCKTDCKPSNWGLFVRDARLIRAVARRYGRPYTLVHLKFGGFDETAARFDANQAKEIIGQAITRLSKSIRRTDLIGRLSHSDYFLMLIETPAQGAEVVLRRSSELESDLLREGLKLRIRQHCFPGSTSSDPRSVPKTNAA